MKTLNINSANALIKALSKRNISIASNDYFHYDGKTAVNNELMPIKYASVYRLKENENLFDFLFKYIDHKIILCCDSIGNIIYNNELRAFID